MTPNDGSALTSARPHLTWIGHATFVLRLGGLLVVTDPIWSERIGPLFRRKMPPGVAMDGLPAVDLVTVSHSHYDHMDLPTLRALDDRFGPTFLVPTDNADLLRRAGVRNVIELAWWEAHRAGDLEVRLVPAHHWSRRTFFDTNRQLWGGFVFRASAGAVYFAGDTAYSEVVFRQVAERCAPLDLAILPIGAYDPPWFMASQHTSPEEAGRAFELVGARTLVPMHYGTFDMTDEPLGEPPERLRDWFRDRGHEPDRLWMLSVGETRTLELG